MWPFNKKNRQKEYIKNLFEGYVKPNVMDEILDNSSSLKFYSKRNIYYVLVMINQNNDFSQTLSNLIDYTLDKNGVIDTIDICLVKIFFGGMSFYEKTDIHHLHSDFIKNIPEMIKNNCSFLYGNCNCFVGNIGNKSRMNYTALLPDYKEKLDKLIKIGYGNIVEDSM